MSRALPPLNALRAFEAAARHESFSRAADELNVSHSAISRHVRGLEDRLGVQLFRDLSRGVALTADGRAYLSRIGPALDRISDATEALTEAPTGRITINAEPLFAHKMLVPLLPSFERAHPEVDVRLEASSSIADLDRFEADLAVRFLHKGVTDRPSDLLTDAPICVCAAPALAKQVRVPRDVLQFNLLKDRGEPVWHQWLTAQGIEDGPPDTGWRMRPSLAVEAAMHGYGVLLASEECLHADLSAGRLVRIFPTDLRGGTFHLVYGHGGPRSKAGRVFRRWLLDATARFRGAAARAGSGRG